MEAIDGTLPVTLTVKFINAPKGMESEVQEGANAVGKLMGKSSQSHLTECESKGIRFSVEDDNPRETDVIRKFIDEWRELISNGHEERSRKYPKVEVTDEGINITHYVDAGDDPLETMADWIFEVFGDEIVKKLETKEYEKTLEETMRGKGTEFVDVPEVRNGAREDSLKRDDQVKLTYDFDIADSPLERLTAHVAEALGGERIEAARRGSFNRAKETSAGGVFPLIERPYPFTRNIDDD